MLSDNSKCSYWEYKSKVSEKKLIPVDSEGIQYPSKGCASVLINWFVIRAFTDLLLALKRLYDH